MYSFIICVTTGISVKLYYKNNSKRLYFRFSFRAPNFHIIP